MTESKIRLYYQDLYIQDRAMLRHWVERGENDEVTKTWFDRINKARPILTRSIQGFQKYLSCPDTAFRVLPPEGEKNDGSSRHLIAGNVSVEDNAIAARFSAEIAPTPQTMTPRMRFIFSFLVSFREDRAYIQGADDGKEFEVKDDLTKFYEDAFRMMSNVLQKSSALAATGGSLKVRVRGFSTQ